MWGDLKLEVLWKKVVDNLQFNISSSVCCIYLYLIATYPPIQMLCLGPERWAAPRLR